MVYEGLDFSTTAVLVWPVEWLDKKRPKPELKQLHVTNVYMPNTEGFTKDDVLNALNLDEHI